MDVLTIGQHDDVIPQYVEKDLAQRYVVAVLLQTEGPQGTYPSASMDTSEMTLWCTSLSDYKAGELVSTKKESRRVRIRPKRMGCNVMSDAKCSRTRICTNLLVCERVQPYM